MKEAKTALGIIDAQAGFMPEAEGARLGLDGFGELGVVGGQEIIAPLNRLAEAAPLVFTTQDWHHPNESIHFSDEPNFVTTWPRHCVANTPGAMLHPELHQPANTTHFFKGREPLQPGDEDLTYSGFYATTEQGQSLEQWLREQNVQRVVLGGLALSHCVGETALDLKKRLDLDVIIAIDAARSVTPELGKLMLQRLETAGVKTRTVSEAIPLLTA